MRIYWRKRIGDFVMTEKLYESRPARYRGRRRPANRRLTWIIFAILMALFLLAWFA